MLFFIFKILFAGQTIFEIHKWEPEINIKFIFCPAYSIAFLIWKCSRLDKLMNTWNEHLIFICPAYCIAFLKWKCCRPDKLWASTGACSWNEHLTGQKTIIRPTVLCTRKRGSARPWNEHQTGQKFFVRPTVLRFCPAYSMAFLFSSVVRIFTDKPYFFTPPVIDLVILTYHLIHPF